ncbi:hypothetical protein [Anthocerotibacter panamensis]|nr:hypothetical protein [Anthocerotibacter panamensis]
MSKLGSIDLDQQMVMVYRSEQGAVGWYSWDCKSPVWWNRSSIPIDPEV